MSFLKFLCEQNNNLWMIGFENFKNLSNQKRYEIELSLAFVLQNKRFSFLFCQFNYSYKCVGQFFKHVHELYSHMTMILKHNVQV
jgi:hypothetical protein